MASTRTYGGEGAPVDEQSLGELVATASRDISLLVRQEIELAKAEIAEQVKRGGIGVGLLGGAGVMALFGLILLCFAASFGLAAGANIPVWAGFLCIGGLFAIGAGALVVLGVLNLKKIGPPTRVVSSVKADLAFARRRGQSPEASQNGSG